MSEATEVSEILEETQEGYFIEGLPEGYQVEESEDGDSLTLHYSEDGIDGEEINTYWKVNSDDQTILNNALEHAKQNQEDDLE